MVELILASGNKHKVQEINEILEMATESIKVKNPLKTLEVEETGTTFEENALLKAQAYYQEYKKPVLSDDSGIIVEALPDELGVRSARFGGEGLSDEQRCDLLLEKLSGVQNRNAHFKCILCFYLSPEEIYYFEGKLEGRINEVKSGNKGFGYDPIFHPFEIDALTQNPVNMGHEEDYTDLSLAMLPEWKKKYGHRSRALQFAINFFYERNCQS